MKAKMIGTHCRIPFLLEALALLLIPFEEALVLPLGSVLRIVNIITIFFAACMSGKVVLGKKKGSPQIAMLIFVVFTMISYVWCYNRDLFFDRISTYLLYTVLAILLYSLSPSDREELIMLRGLYLGGALASVLVVFGTSQTVRIGDRMTLEVLGSYIDPNILSYSVSISIIIGLYGIVHNNRAFGKWKVAILCAVEFVMATAIILLGSRGAFLSVAITMLFLLWKVDYGRYSKLKKAGLIISICLMVAIFYWQVVPGSIAADRFSLSNLLGQGTLGTANRTVIWRSTFEQFTKRPILGYGNGAAPYAIAAVYKFYGTHNTYLSVLLEFGIVGLCLFGNWMIRINVLFKRQEDSIYRYMLTSLLVFIVFVEGLTTKVFWGVIVLIMVSAQRKTEN